MDIIIALATFLPLLAWVWVAKTAADDVDCAHINDLQTKKVDTDWKDYKARAYLTVNQEDIADKTATKVLLNTESWDPGGNFDHVVNHRFIAPIDGFYQANAACRYTKETVVADKRYYCTIRLNNVDWVMGMGHAAFAESVIPTCSDVIEMTAAQYLELFCYHDAGIDTIDIDDGSPNTFLSVHILSI